MKSTILNEGSCYDKRYQVGKCYLWTTAGRKLIILCSQSSGGSLAGTIINVIEKQPHDVEYVVGYYSEGWTKMDNVPWTGKIQLETE